MNVVLAILILAIVTVVVLAVGAPLRRAERERVAGGGEAEPEPNPGAQENANRQDDLLAAREAKYREIRDAELDYRTGKLSREDFDAIDAELRAQAIEILNRLESEDLPPGSAGETDDERDGQASAESKTAARPRDA